MKHILMATDLSARSDRALQRAVALALRRGASLEVMHVVDDTLPPTIIELQKAAARTHGRAGLRHLLVGSVAADMLSDPPVDVLVAKD